MANASIAKQSLLTQARLKELLHYDPETGIFTWRVHGAHGKIRPGMVAGGLTADISKKRNGAGYWRIRVDGIRYRSHRLAWLYMTGAWPKVDVDHKDTDRGNNRWVNLREATPMQNGHNRTLSMLNTSGTNGVYWRKDCAKWAAKTRINGARLYLGAFSRKEDAVAAMTSLRLSILEPSS